MKTKITTLAIIVITILSCNNKKERTLETSKETIEVKDEVKSETTNDLKLANIENIEWILTILEGEEVNKLNETDRDIHFILNSNSNRVSGFSGCNAFMGTYSLEGGNRIKFSKLASTRKACPIAAIDESELLNVLEMTDNFTINNGKLILNTKKIKSLAEFENAELYEPIVEKYWKLKTLDGKDVIMADNQEREIFFTLKGHNNSVTGFAGCNSISGEYKLEDDNRIRFENMATTLKACPDVAINEAEFLKIFELADNYTISEGLLSLNVGKRAPLAVFEADYM